MTRQELELLFDRIRKIWTPKAYSREVMEVWWSVLKNEQTRDVEGSIQFWQTYKKTRPTLNDVKESIARRNELRAKPRDPGGSGCGRCSYRGWFPMYNPMGQSKNVGCNCQLGHKMVSSEPNIISEREARRMTFRYFSELKTDDNGNSYSIRRYPSTAHPEWINRTDPSACPWNPRIAALLNMSVIQSSKTQRIISDQLRKMKIKDDDFMTLIPFWEKHDWQNPAAIAILKKHPYNKYDLKVM